MVEGSSGGGGGSGGMEIPALFDCLFKKTKIPPLLISSHQLFSIARCNKGLT